MSSFNEFHGLVAPIDRPNVDTDAIIPKQYMKSVNKIGFGPYLFDEWRYKDIGEPGMPCEGRIRNEEFILNQAAYESTSILLARENFGCGSSREHAVWALHDFGIRVVVAPSFADIFYTNCTKNGILPAIVSAEVIEKLFAAAWQEPGVSLSVSLPNQKLRLKDLELEFDIQPRAKKLLLHGGDEIEMTKTYVDSIERYEKSRIMQEPWLFPDVT